MKKEKIDFYGNKDNYIHLKFGDCTKAYNFTDDLLNKYPDFTKEYINYWNGNDSKFRNAFQIVSYIYDFKIPVHLYYNYTDTPCKNKKEVIEYLLKENTSSYNLKS